MKNGSSIFGYNSDDIRSGDVEYASVEDNHDSPAPRRMNKTVYAIVIAALSAALAVGLIWTLTNRINEGLVMELQVGDILPYTVEDGQYSGSFVSGGMGASVTVTVESGYITDIALEAFDGIDTARAHRVFEAVIDAQSLFTADGEVGTAPTDIILLMAIEQAVNG